MRRNRASGTPQTWGYIRGNALLELVAEKILVETPLGPFITYWRQDPDIGPALVVVRAGTPKPWWYDDLDQLLLLNRLFGRHAGSAIILHENDGNLKVLVHKGLLHKDDRAMFESLALSYEGDKRLDKRGYRATVQCPRCPIKAACDALDIENGEQQDWPNGYQAGKVVLK